MTEFPFIGPAYKGRSANYSVQRTVNLYLEGGKGKTPGQLIGTPGLTAPWVTLTGAGVRAMYALTPTTAIMVCGGSVYKVTSAGVATSLGAVANDGKLARIVSCVNESDTDLIVIASAGSLYSVSLSGSSSTLIRADSSDVDYLDGYFITTESNSDVFAFTDTPLTTSFAAGYHSEANGSPDLMVGLRVARRTIYFFGTKSIEQWYNAAASIDLPFARIDGGFFEVGCVAKDSIAEMDAIFWLGGDEKGAGQVWTISGGAPKRISTPAIEFAISQWPDMSDAEAFTYSQEGHSFYVLSSTSGNETWVYDITTEEWHQRAWLHASGELHRIRPRCHLYFAGKNLVGDWETGAVYEYDLDTFSDNGNPLPAIRVCGTLQDGLANQKSTSLQLDMDTGVGLATGQGSDPQAMLRWSKDGGKTWSNSLWRTFGKIGEYTRRCIWRRIGGGRRMVFEVTITDPVKRCITSAFLGN